MKVYDFKKRTCVVNSNSKKKEDKTMMPIQKFFDEHHQEIGKIEINDPCIKIYLLEFLKAKRDLEKALDYLRVGKSVRRVDRGGKVK
ncbi:MAG: hypothetical protein HY097_01770 [Nitrospinae bacterium]|nr:hypothetical protein [Nitrospinota bacterium]MBI3813343.1 hypothetical protein [Nitrospinota bacterium]